MENSSPRGPESESESESEPPEPELGSNSTTTTATATAIAMIDLRSDTVTRPTQAMRDAMATAAVGDDGWGDDPTAKELESFAAATFGKEAGLFVPSGIMANLISVLCHCRERGSEAIVGSKSHMCIWEQGGMATIGGVHPRQLPNNSDGTIDLGDIEDAIRTYDPHFPVTRLICLENTHNHCGGRVLTMGYMAECRKIADRHGVPMHLDGARVMNAATKLGVAPSEIGEHFDSISFCLSKALSAPIGSVIVSSKSFIEKCRHFRKAIGGQLRQVGCLCAPGLIALREMPKELAEDHACALALAEGLNQVKNVTIRLDTVETNIMVVDVSQVPSHEDVVPKLKARGVLAANLATGMLRLCTHYAIREKEVQAVIEAFKAICE